MTATIVVNIHGSMIELTPEEAKKLFLALHKIFSVTTAVPVGQFGHTEDPWQPKPMVDRQRFGTLKEVWLS